MAAGRTQTDEGGSPRDLVEVLRRWQDSGAVWRVLSESSGRLTVGLFTCDGGQEVERLTTADPAVVTFVAGRSSSDDPGPAAPR